MKEWKHRLPFVNTCISSGDIQVWKMCKVCKWDNWWCHTLNPILLHVYKLSYLGQFAAQINSYTENTTTATKNFVAMATLSFAVPTTWFQYVSDFQLEKRYTLPQTQANIFVCLLDHVYQALFPNMKIERQGWPEIPLILGRSGTQYVAMGTQLLCSNYSRILLQRIKHFWYKLAEISFSSYLIKTWLSAWRHHLANLHLLKTWISLEQKEIF